MQVHEQNTVKCKVKEEHYVGKLIWYIVVSVWVLHLTTFYNRHFDMTTFLSNLWNIICNINIFVQVYYDLCSYFYK